MNQNSYFTYFIPRDDCHKRGGHLLVIPDSTTQTFVMYILGRIGYKGNALWIGLNDRASERNWRWDTGKYKYGTFKFVFRSVESPCLEKVRFREDLKVGGLNSEFRCVEIGLNDFLNPHDGYENWLYPGSNR